MTSVKLSEGLTRIGDQTFGRCNALETIEIPASLTSIGNDAFKNCAKLRSIRCYANSSTWQPRYICDSNTTVYYSYNPNHTHSYKSHVIKMSGCTYSGSEEEICEFCGDYYTKETPALGQTGTVGKQQKMLPVKVTEKKLIPAEDVVTKRKRQFRQPDIAG